MFVVSCFNSRVSCFLFFLVHVHWDKPWKLSNATSNNCKDSRPCDYGEGSLSTPQPSSFFSPERRGRYVLCQSCHPDLPEKNFFVYKRDANVENWAPTSITILILHPPARKALSIHPVWTSNMLYPPVFAVLILYPQRGRCSSNPNVLLPSGHAWHNCRYNGHASDADDFRQLNACDEIWLMDQFDWSSGLL